MSPPPPNLSHLPNPLNLHGIHNLLIHNSSLTTTLLTSVSDWIRRQPTTSKDLSTLSLALSSLSQTLTSARPSLEFPLQPLPCSQGQRDALIALKEVLRRCEKFLTDLQAVFAKLEVEGFAHIMLAAYAKAENGMGDVVRRLEEVREWIGVGIGVVRVHWCLREGGVEGDVRVLKEFGRRPVRYGVDEGVRIRFCTLVAKTVLMVRVCGEGGEVGGDVRRQMEAWVARDYGADVGDFERRRSGLLTTVQGENNRDDDREIDENGGPSSEKESHISADLIQKLTGLNHRDQEKMDEISRDRLNELLVPEAGPGSIFQGASPSTCAENPPATSSQPDIVAPGVVSTKTHTTKLVKNPTSTHRRSTFKGWVKKWCKPR